MGTAFDTAGWLSAYTENPGWFAVGGCWTRFREKLAAGNTIFLLIDRVFIIGRLLFDRGISIFCSNLCCSFEISFFWLVNFWVARRIGSLIFKGIFWKREIISERVVLLILLIVPIVWKVLKCLKLGDESKLWRRCFKDRLLLYIVIRDR